MPPPLPELPAVAHRYEVVDGVRIHYAEAGSGDPVVLVHGWPQHWWLWRDYFAPLAERFRVIAPDLRGHGWSDKPRSSYLKADLAGDVLGLLDRLGIERVRWVGHDWGGGTGLLAALHHPERIERFMPMSFPHPWRGFDPRAALAAAIYQPIVGGPFGRLAMQHLNVARRVLQAGRSIGSYSDDELETYAAVFRDRDAADATVHLYRTFMLRETPVFLRDLRRMRLTVPTLWLFGEKDVIARSDDGYVGHADDMTLECVEGANHFLPEEMPELVLERMLAFL